MKYRKALNWDLFGQSVIEGKIKLQIGQWITIGGKKSRFLWSTDTTAYAIHPWGSRGISIARLQEAIASWPNRPKR